MRDESRIDRVLGLLKRYWHANPDLRLGQIVWNMAGRDPFNLRDDELEAALNFHLSDGD